MPRAVKLFPYNVASDLQLKLLDAFDTKREEEVDLTPILSSDPDELFKSYDLSDPDLLWTTVSLSLQAGLAADSLKELLPPGGDPSKDLALVVSVRCAKTKVRETYFLEEVADGKWEGDVLIRRAMARGAIELVPFLARRTSRPGEESGSFAVDRSAIVAEGSGLRFVVDLEDRPVHGDIDFKWEDFSKSENGWRREHASDVFYLDPSRSRPRLYLNTRYRKFKAALEDAKRDGLDAVVRNLGNAALAHSVWLQLFVAAVSGIEYDEEEQGGHVEPPPDEWKRHVLRRFGAIVFPERNELDRLRAFAEQMRSPDQVGALLSRVGTAAQEIVGTYKLVEGAIRAGEREGNFAR